MAEKNQGRLLTKEEFARRAAKYAAKDATKKETRKAKTSAKTEVKKRASLEEVEQKLKAQQAKSDEFKATLSSGGSLPGVDEGFTTSSPTQISDNRAHFNALSSMMADFENRISRVKDTVATEAKKNAAAAAKKLGVDVNKVVDAKGRRISFTDTRTSNKLSPAEDLIAQARKHLNNSWNAHLAGGANGALTAAESFTKAGDTFTAALNHVRSEDVFGKSQKYKKVFTSGDEGNQDSPVNIDLNAHEKVTNIVNGYTDHVLDRASSVGTIPKNVASEVKPVLSRDYDTVFTVPQVVEAAGRYAPKTDEEKATIAEKRARQLENKAKDQAMIGKTNIVKPSEDYPSTPLSIKDIPSIPGAGRTFSVSKEGKAEQVGSYVTPPSSVDNSFNVRWGRAQVQPVFEYNEKQNAASAAEVGKSYTPKTFVGSEAHTNPVAWHLRNQVRSHWLSTTKGARPEDFENSDAHHDPLGYVAKHADSKKPVSQKPLEFDARKSARLTTFVPNPKSVAEKLIFTPRTEQDKTDRPTKTTFAPFYPTPGQETAAEKGNQETAPESVNKSQLSASRASGAAFTRKETSAAFTSDAKDYDPNPAEATTKSVAEAEASKVIGRPVSLNAHFSSGTGK
jgi:hypothetical protein